MMALEPAEDQPEEYVAMRKGKRYCPALYRGCRTKTGVGLGNSTPQYRFAGVVWRQRSLQTSKAPRLMNAAQKGNRVERSSRMK